MFERIGGLVLVMAMLVLPGAAWASYDGVRAVTTGKQSWNLKGIAKDAIDIESEVDFGSRYWSAVSEKSGLSGTYVVDGEKAVLQYDAPTLRNLETQLEDVVADLLEDEGYDETPTVQLTKIKGKAKWSGKGVLKLKHVFKFTFYLAALGEEVSGKYKVKTEYDPIPDKPKANGRVMLFVATSADTSSYFMGEKLESDSQVIFRYEPKNGWVKRMAENRSYSYAKSTIRSYTVDDRFFVYDTHHESTRTDLSEYTPKKGDLKYSKYVSDPTDGDCLAVVGDTLYYRERSEWDYLYGTIGGNFRKLANIDGAGASEGQTLFPLGHAHNCHYNLDAVDGGLYDAIKDGDQIEFYARSLSTGALASVLGSFTISDDADYEWYYHIVFDRGGVYWARTGLDGTIEVWRYDFGAAQPYPVLAEKIAGIKSAISIDADEGHVAVHLRGTDGRDNRILWIDEGNRTAQVIDMGIDVYDVQILHLDD